PDDRQVPDRVRKRQRVVGVLEQHQRAGAESPGERPAISGDIRYNVGLTRVWMIEEADPELDLEDRQDRGVDLCYRHFSGCDQLGQIVPKRLARHIRSEEHTSEL